ncbi:dihydrofolate reductase-like domain-containing protein [Cladorrhinum samala]|uniref:2,5-diamino-6-ribosylamino-4(3H)-pyrimidinone 5'-phosphate reductase n=1 Tax=Cladorrhinum samala TaxID=585594 RepID=A0AAV9H9R9_9PEZI|nr:dihydrofolate reductase-like domain-containing protein [Cladorrhinum samala]
MSRPDSLTFPPHLIPPLSPYLPRPDSRREDPSSLPFLTLTYAASLDSMLSLAPGVRTALSGPLTKSMTHHLRTRHSAILIGVNTALADDPALNSRLVGAPLSSQPRPVILDPEARWDFTSQSKVIQLAERGEGKAPFVVAGEGVEVSDERRSLLERAGGKFLALRRGKDGGKRFDWGDVLRLLKSEGLDSVMVEGGGEVINSLLGKEGNRYVDSVIVTIAPTWLGKGGVVVSPERSEGAQLRLRDVVWQGYGEDVVLCGRIER